MYLFITSLHHFVRQLQSFVGRLNINHPLQSTQSLLAQVNPCIIGCHQFAKQLKRTCYNFDNDLLMVLHFSEVL